MPIKRLLAESQVPPEQHNVLEQAFNNSLSKLGLVDRNDPICEMVARKVLEIGRRGVTSVVDIVSIVLRELGP
jgi:hypothetical protein